jgi:hypothetical protein
MFPFVFEINPAGWAHLAYFGLFLPVMVVRGRMKIRDTKAPLPNRLRHFQVTTFSLPDFLLKLTSGRYRGYRIGDGCHRGQRDCAY